MNALILRGGIMTAVAGFSKTESSPWELASFRINGEDVPWNSPGIGLRRGQSNELTVQAPWLSGTKINLGLVSDEGLVIRASPEFGEWVPEEGNTAKWTLTPDNISGRVRLVFFGRKFEQVHNFPCWVLSSNLSDEGFATLGSTVTPIPADSKKFWPAIGRTLNFQAKPGSPIAGFPLMLKVQAKQPGADPVTSIPLVMAPTTNQQWSVTAVTEAREVAFDLIISGQGMTPLTVSDCVRFSSNLLDYATIKLNDVDVPADGARFKGDTPGTLSVVAKPGSPSLDSMYLYWEKGGGQLNGNDFKSDPGFTFPNGSMTWDITCPARTSGEFALRIRKVFGATQTSFRCLLVP
ncbi:UNVERIFIED_ORG: hypothetical protein J2Y76_003701 [Pseudomonas reinekei]|uniref:hypothetical protein n=1 Tax=Pseudomonas laurylsulfatiphila TaxID=2011015 RepID=UPI003D227C3A|nr:hypothetical protein [Pseudomonas reinekei]